MKKKSGKIRAHGNSPDAARAKSFEIVFRHVVDVEEMNDIAHHKHEHFLLDIKEIVAPKRVYAERVALKTSSGQRIPKRI
jgi:hypothetical protein